MTNIPSSAIVAQPVVDAEPDHYLDKHSPPTQQLSRESIDIAHDNAKITRPKAQNAYENTVNSEQVPDLEIVARKLGGFSTDFKTLFEPFQTALAELKNVSLVPQLSHNNSTAGSVRKRKRRQTKAESALSRAEFDLRRKKRRLKSTLSARQEQQIDEWVGAFDKTLRNGSLLNSSC